MDRVVICMKWGRKYDADYVTVLHRATRKNLSGDFRFVCLTDDTTGIVDDTIETFPIPEIGCTSEMWANGAWPKLSVFSKELYGLEGRALFIDLDTVISGSLDQFFEHEDPVIGYEASPKRKWWKSGGGLGSELGTGIFAFDIGAQSQVVTRFQDDPAGTFQECKLEQIWVQKTAQGGISFWPEGWVVSFKRDLRRPIGMDLIFEPKRPAPGVSVVAFHGKPQPHVLLRRGLNYWDRFPHLGRGQVSWIQEYWLTYGGKPS